MKSFHVPMNVKIAIAASVGRTRGSTTCQYTPPESAAVDARGVLQVARHAFHELPQQKTLNADAKKLPTHNG